MKKLLFLGVFSLALLNSCLKTEVIPTIPEIKFNSIQNFGDSINILIDFTDGDGNFGLEQGDTTGIFDDCLRSFNLYAEYYEKINGEWVQIVLDPCANPNAVPFYYRVPWAKPTGQNPTQKGTITLAIKTYYFPNENDTLRFDIKIVDRDMQESNTISTSEILKP